MVMGGKDRPSNWPLVEALEAESETAKLPLNGSGPGALAVTVFGIPPLTPSANVVCDPEPGTGQAHAAETKAPTLSEREIQILDGLGKGYANKVIARGCGITEATVKVHMKSILRKIRVGNRTQAAIWALEHGYSSEAANASGFAASEAAERTYIVPS
jgi:two-component system, NarL family, nitrate/nitrite response regulator NarL